ncbi:pectinesterase inhibitor-like [Solanum stenotomum]|uniref:pectinesterase inhibitor-like n=1 Tax=Solanum stenotomum TaxID=172797 RepID=UPI0020D1E08F|nr:pectinesterase inhibitor-like [Solanum stenotomum]
MAKFWSSSLFFLSFVLVTLFGNIPNVKADILDDVCPKTINPPLCFQVLRNDPYVYKGDIHSLLSIVLSIAQDNTTSTYNLIQSILQQPIKYPNMKDQLIGCLKNYKYASDNLESCNDLLRIANYRKISFLAYAAMYESLACNQGFRDVPPQLKQLSKVVQEFSDVSAVIAYDLE